MKLYKNTVIISIIVFFVCVFLSVIFAFTCISDFEIINFLNDYMIGIACSVIVVIITTFLQFKYEQRKALKNILSDIRFLLFQFLLVALSLDSEDDVPDNLWRHYYDEIYNGISKISSELSNIEWFLKDKAKATSNLNRNILQIQMNMLKINDKKNSPVSILYTPLLGKIKDDVSLLTKADDYNMKEIVENYEKIQQELTNLKQKNHN